VSIFGAKIPTLGPLKRVSGKNLELVRNFKKASEHFYLIISLIFLKKKIKNLKNYKSTYREYRSNIFIGLQQQ
jgi:hypothetical protein